MIGAVTLKEGLRRIVNGLEPAASPRLRVNRIVIDIPHRHPRESGGPAGMTGWISARIFCLCLCTTGTGDVAGANPVGQGERRSLPAAPALPVRLAQLAALGRVDRGEPDALAPDRDRVAVDHGGAADKPDVDTRKNKDDCCEAKKTKRAFAFSIHDSTAVIAA
jgi:hypothetical protein